VIECVEDAKLGGTWVARDDVARPLCGRGDDSPAAGGRIIPTRRPTKKNLALPFTVGYARDFALEPGNSELGSFSSNRGKKRSG
jgi:hypothetical protein